MQWGKILRNVLSNSACYFVTAVVGFLLAPFIVHTLGNTGYGLWTLVLSLTGYFGLLDLGIRSSVGRFVARYVTLNDEENVNRVINTAFMMLSAGAGLALLITVIVVLFFSGTFRMEPEYAFSAKTALLITGLTMSCILPLGVFSSILIALERFDVVSGITLITELLRAALVVAVLRMGYGIIGLALVVLLVTVLQYAAMATFAKVVYAPLRFSRRFITRKTASDLWSFGLYRFIWIVANQLIFYSDSVVIGVMINAAAITYFAIAASLINYGRNIVSLVTDTLAPLATRLDANQDLAALRKLMITGTRMALLISLPLCAGYILLGEQFITLWMGRAYASSAVFLAVLAISQIGSMPQYISVLILAGMARHKVLAYVVLAEGIANVLLSIVLIRKLGLLGVAWGTVIPNVVFSAVIVPLYTLRTLEMSPREYLVKAWLRPLACAVPLTALGYIVLPVITGGGWPIFAAQVAVICGAFALASYFVCFNARQRALAFNKLTTLFTREAVVHEA